MKATPLLQKVCTSGHFVRHSTYTGIVICNSSRSEKIRVLRRPPGPPSRSTRGGFGLFSLLDSGTGKAGPLAAFGCYSPKCLEGEFSEVCIQPGANIILPRQAS